MKTCFHCGEELDQAHCFETIGEEFCSQRCALAAATCNHGENCKLAECGPRAALSMPSHVCELCNLLVDYRAAAADCCTCVECVRCDKVVRAVTAVRADGSTYCGEACLDATAERAQERSDADYYGGDGPQTLAESMEVARRMRR